MINTPFFDKFAPVIRNLTNAELSGSVPADEKLCVARQGSLTVCYTPFEYINVKARVVLVGITPGRTQLMNAIRECRRALDAGRPASEALRAAKMTGAFSGTMRPNLIGLLDAIDLHNWLGISSCAGLFGGSSDLVQTTSVLRNAVFVNGENYNGNPAILRSEFLQEQLLSGFGQDAKALPDAVYVPLGDKVAAALAWMVKRGALREDRILSGLPHPSGANAERIAYFLGKKSRAALSAKTDPRKLDDAKSRLIARVGALR
jgi:hypothetical protein